MLPPSYYRSELTACTGIIGSLGYAPHYQVYSPGVQTPIDVSVRAIGQDIGSRSRAAGRDRAHRVDRRVCVITRREKLNDSPRRDNPGPRVGRARRLSSSSKSVMEMSVDVSASRAGGVQKGHSGRLLALEPAPRAACRAIDKQARSPRRLLEQPTEAAHRFHPVFSHKHLMNHDR